MKRAILACALTLAACHRPTSSAAASSTSAAPSASAVPASKSKTTSGTPFPFDPSSDQALELAPLDRAAAPSARQQSLTELLGGLALAERLPLVHTDPQVAYDPELFEASTTAVVAEHAIKPRADATVAAPKLLLGTISNLERVVAGMRTGFRHCYTRALGTEPKLAGKMSLQAFVTASGAVERVTTTSAPAKSYQLKPCVEARVSAAQFEGSNANAKFALDVTFQLSP
jgi:hypothetical protein